MEEGWIRLIVTTIATETVIIVSTYNIAVGKDDKRKILQLIKTKIGK